MDFTNSFAGFTEVREPPIQYECFLVFAIKLFSNSLLKDSLNNENIVKVIKESETAAIGAFQA